MVEVGEINLSRLVEDIGIDEESITKLLSIYVDEMTEEMQQVKKFLYSQEWASLQKTIHNIKGVSANLYLQNMSHASEEVESLLKRQDYSNIKNPIENLLNVFKNTQQSIHNTLNQHQLHS